MFCCLSTLRRSFLAINKRHQHSRDKVTADWGNKWAESLSQAMFLSPLMRLQDCAGTFMDCLIQCGRIQTKSRQTALKLLGDAARRKNTQKHKDFINNKTLPDFISPPVSIHSLQRVGSFFYYFFWSAFFLPVKMGFVLMSWASY